MPKVVKALTAPSAGQPIDSVLLGEYIRAKRTQLGLTIEDTAAFCRVTKDTLMNLEHGNGRVQLGSALQVCKGLGIKLEIISWENEGSNNVWV